MKEERIIHCGEDSIDCSQFRISNFFVSLLTKKVMLPIKEAVLDFERVHLTFFSRVFGD